MPESTPSCCPVTRSISATPGAMLLVVVELLYDRYKEQIGKKHGAGDETRTRDIFLGKENCLSAEPLKQ